MVMCMAHAYGSGGLLPNRIDSTVSCVLILLGTVSDSFGPGCLVLGCLYLSDEYRVVAALATWVEGVGLAYSAGNSSGGVASMSAVVCRLEPACISMSAVFVSLS